MAIYCDAFAPYSKLSNEELRLRCLAIIGVGDAITREMSRGRASSLAAATLASLIVASLSDSK